MMIATQVGVRSASVERAAEVSVLYTIAHVVVVPAYHAARIRDAGYVGLRLDASVGRAR